VVIHKWKFVQFFKIFQFIGIYVLKVVCDDSLDFLSVCCYLSLFNFEFANFDLSLLILVRNELGVEGRYLNIIKAIYYKPIANRIFNEEKLKTFPLKSGTRYRYPLYPLLFNIVLKFLARKKGLQIGKEIIKVPLFADDMILYLKDPKNYIPKLLDTINSVNNVAGYKIYLQKSVAFLYRNSEQIEKEYI
jgi:hypothetical protein